jgi:hypothetical protein
MNPAMCISDIANHNQRAAEGAGDGGVYGALMMMMMMMVVVVVVMAEVVLVKAMMRIF